MSLYSRTEALKETAQKIFELTGIKKGKYTTVELYSLMDFIVNELDLSYEDCCIICYLTKDFIKVSADLTDEQHYEIIDYICEHELEEYYNLADDVSLLFEEYRDDYRLYLSAYEAEGK